MGNVLNCYQRGLFSNSERNLCPGKNNSFCLDFFSVGCFFAYVCGGVFCGRWWIFLGWGFFGVCMGLVCGVLGVFLVL